MALFQVTKKVRERYPQLNFYGVKVEDVRTTKKLLYVKARKKGIQRDFREMYTLENLKEVPQVKAMRDLFVAMGDDPEKNLTAVENLASLLLRGGLPSINSVVDSCNLASLQTLMPIGVFDSDKVMGTLVLDLSEPGEEYEPIGMEKEMLAEGLLILRDDEGVISRPMYKDSKKTMITEGTKSVYILTAQYLPILEVEAKKALEVAVDLVTTSSLGSAGAIGIFSDE
ncbi:MAG: phenylalanine--tRNA ligase beta subunit-related protein [Desulfobacterales bacterium]|jgi:DNA/RNA-binding domain of Phe-tRNA-synthetase-like protein